MEEIRRHQEEARRQIQRERLREPVHSQLGRVRQELENQQFQINQPIAQGVIRNVPQGHVNSLQDQVQQVEDHLQEVQRRRTVSFGEQYMEMKNQDQGQGQGQQRGNGL